jgi:hypothetical protein
MIRQLPDLRENRVLMVIGLSLWLALNLAWLLLVNMPRSQALASADQRVQSLRRDTSRRVREVKDLQEAVERIRNREHTLELFFGQVLAGKSERMVAIQRELREIAIRHRIDPKKISYSHEPVEDTVDMVRFGARFPLRGGYQALRSFIRDIEHSKNFLIIDGVDLAKSREGGALLALDIAVSTMFRDSDREALESRKRR